jgi:hypothetical protein
MIDDQLIKQSELVAMDEYYGESPWTTTT